MAFVIPFIPAIVGALTTSTLYIGIATALSVVASGFLAAKARRKQEAAARDAYNASLRDRTTMIRSTTEGRDLVLGRVRKSGQIAYIASAGSRREKLYIVLALAGHECDAIEAYYLNDVEVAVDGSGNVTTAPYVRFERQPADALITLAGGAGSVVVANTPIAGSARAVQNNASGLDSYEIPASISGTTLSVTGVGLPDGTVLRVSYEWNRPGYYVNLRSYLGTDSQTADAGLIAALPGTWTSNHRLRGVCYLVAELLFNDDVFTSGIPNISVRLRGAKVFDPRTSTTVWTQNPALMMRHAALHPLCGRLVSGQMNDASFIAAANVCDQDVTYSVVINGVATAFNRDRFTAGTVFKSGSRPKEALDDLATAMAGDWCFNANQLVVRAGAYTSPVLTLGDDDFGDAGGVEIQPYRGREQLFNVVTATYADEQDSYRVVPMPRVAPAAYITADGAELPVEVEFAAIGFVGQAQYVAGIMLRDSRQGLTITASFKMRAYPLQVLDIVALTNSRFGWSAKPFKVMNRRWTLDGLIQLTLKEIDASIYTMEAEFPSGDPAPNTNLPTPWVVAALTGLAGTSGTTPLLDGTSQTRARITWTQHTEEQVLRNGFVQIQYTRADQVLPADDWPSTQVPGSATEATIVGLTAGGVYLFRARALSTLGRSPWTPLLALRVADAGAPLFRVVARGLSDTQGPHAPGLFDGRTDAALAAAGFMYRVVRIRRSDAVITYSAAFDTLSSPGAPAAMAAALNATDSSSIVVVVSYDEPSANRLTGGLLDAMLRCGASRGVFGSPQFRVRAAYVLVAIGGCGEGNGYEAYSGTIDSDTNAWCDVSFSLERGNLLIGGTTATPRTLADYSYTGDLNATSDLVLVAGTGMQVTGNSAVKATGTGAWDAHCYSAHGSTNGAFAIASPAQADRSLMFGLNSDPTTDQSFTSLDYAIFLTNAGAVRIYENGADIGAFGAYVAGDVFSVLYDGATVRYLKGATVLRTLAVAPNLALHFDSSFYDVGGRLNGIRFGPMSPVTNIGTGQLQPNAATEILLATFVAGPVSFSTIA